MTNFKFATVYGVHVKEHDAIFPIMKVIDGAWHPVGTGFFISSNGIFITAWHVLRDALDNDGEMNCDGIAAFHFLSGNQYIVRPVLRSCHHVKSDIAVGVLAEAKHNTTGLLLANKTMILTTTPQKKGSEIVTWAYPRTIAGFESSVQTIRFAPNFYSGIVEEHFPTQRDNYLMPFPCYRGSIKVLGGASGGPVVNLDNGRVFGVNCTGINGDDEGDVSHYSSLAVINELWVNDVTIDGERHDRMMISELISRGFINCD